jgi:hypothetical protein
LNVTLEHGRDPQGKRPSGCEARIGGKHRRDARQGIKSTDVGQVRQPQRNTLGRIDQRKSAASEIVLSALITSAPDRCCSFNPNSNTSLGRLAE